MAQGLNAATSNATSVEEVRANFKAMLGEATPEQIGLRLEVLRATNKITGQEYGVYPVSYTHLTLPTTPYV